MVRNKEKEKTNGFNNHLLIVISLTWTDMITVRSFHCTVHVPSLSHGYDLVRHLNRTEPLLMLLVTLLI